MPQFEGCGLGIPWEQAGDGDSWTRRIVEDGVLQGVPGGEPIEFRVLRPGGVPFTVVDEETGAPVRRVTLGFERGVPHLHSGSGGAASARFTTGDSDFLLAAAFDQPVTVGGVGYRTCRVENLRSLPRDERGRFVVALQPDGSAPMLRLRWDRERERFPGGVTVHIRERGQPPPRADCDGVDRLRPNAEGGAADLGPPEKGPLRWIVEMPGRVLVGGEWQGGTPEKVALDPPREARLLLRRPIGELGDDLFVSIRSPEGAPIPFLAAGLFAPRDPPIHDLHDPLTGREHHELSSIYRLVLIGGLPSGRVTLGTRIAGRVEERVLDLVSGNTLEVDVP